MTWGKVGSTGVTQLTATGAVNYGQTPTKGNKGVITFVHVRASNSLPTSSLPATWTLIDNDTQVNGIVASAKITRYYRDFDGTANDNAPTLTIGVGPQCRVYAEEFKGLMPGPPEIIATPASDIGANNNAAIGSYSPGSDDTFIQTAFGYFSTNTTATASISSPHTNLTALSNGGAGGLFAYVATYQNTLNKVTAQSPTVTWINGSGSPCGLVVSCAWKIDRDGWGVVE